MVEGPSTRQHARLNMIGENPSLPAIVNDPARLGKLVAEKRKRADEREAKEQRKKAKTSAGQKRKEKADAKDAQQKKEAPVAGLLLELGFKRDEKKKVTMCEMKAFLRKNHLKYDHGKTSRAQVMDRLLSRLSASPPSSGWRGAADEAEAGNDSSESESESEEEEDGQSESSGSAGPVFRSTPRVRRVRSFVGQVRSDLSDNITA